MKTSPLFLRNGVPEKIVIFMYTNHKEVNYSGIARGIGCTYSATCKNLRLMEELGIIELSELDNKSKQIKLTEKGQKIVEFLKEFDKI
jgi:DNA-binding MarR family transcriptional regulator